MSAQLAVIMAAFSHSPVASALSCQAFLHRHLLDSHSDTKVVDRRPVWGDRNFSKTG